ncbi:hypothetical protein ABPG75_005576 [Micractinium tetrahymenae]
MIYVKIKRRGRGGAAPAPPAPAAAPERSLTERMFEQMERNAAAGEQALGAGGVTSLEALRRADAAWRSLRTRTDWGPRPEFVHTTAAPLGAPADVDVAVCGGVLGIFLACALQLRGLRVAVLERGPLLGRTQEWNISRKELQELVEMGLLSEQEAEESITSEFNPVRIGFHGDAPGQGAEVWTRDVLNLGASPARLVAAARARFEAAGGRVLERTALEGLWVHPDGVRLQLGCSGGSSNGSTDQQQQQQQGSLTSRLVLDCMGHASPIVQQVRWGRKPDGVCLVVGTCCRGFDPEKNTTGDVIYTNGNSQPAASSSSSSSSSSSNGSSSNGSSGNGSSPSSSSSEGVFNTQFFWEAFPAGSGPADRTTYLFTYLDAQPSRPSLEAMLDEYWRLMPEYQGLQLEDLQVLRILFGWFPTFRDSPLRPAFDRVLQVGDASGIQSPLSFGGFGALTRHLRRLSGAITEALEVDALDRGSLGWINAYNPGLSGAWMLQRAMSVDAAAGPGYDRTFINRLLAENFQAMQKLGEPVLKPFLQDVIQLGPLVRSLAQQMVSNPGMVPQILGRVGLPAMLDWLRHLAGLTLFTFLHWDVQKYKPLIERLPPRQRFFMRRAMEQWEYGAGKDYKL